MPNDLFSENLLIIYADISRVNRAYEIYLENKKYPMVENSFALYTFVSTETQSGRVSAIVVDI